MLTFCPAPSAANEQFDLVHFGKDNTIYHQEQILPCAYTVVQGIVRTCRYQAEGKRQVTGFYYPGDTFGIEAYAYCGGAEAIGSVTCRRIGKPRSPANTVNIHAAESVQHLRQALDLANRSIFLFGRRTAAERLAAFITYIAERSGNFTKVALPMSRTDIADYLGLSLHTVSRTMTQLCDKALIALNGPHQCQILNVAELRQLACHDF